RAWYIQYVEWIRGLVVGDLGTSYAARLDIAEQIWRRLGVTSLLAFSTLAISAIIALVLGTYSAINSTNAKGAAVDVGAQIGMAIPNFWAGLLLVVILAIGLGWLPAGGYELIRHGPNWDTRLLFLSA